MKTFEHRKNNAIKLAKGMLSIFMIKLILFGGAFIVQSCQNEDIMFKDSEKQLALEKFGNLVKVNTTKVQNLIIQQQNLLAARNTNLEEVNIQTNQEAKETLMPILEGTKELLREYGISEEYYAEVFEDTNDPRIALVGLAVFVAESNEVNQTAFNFASLLATPTYAMNQQWKCIMEAIGLPAGMIAGGMRNMTVKALLKSAAKLSGRVLGWVGLAWAVADYTSCMGYW